MKEVAGYALFFQDLSRAYILVPSRHGYYKEEHMGFGTDANGASYRLAPYEKRVIELIRNGKDKRARKLAKKRVC